MYAEKLSEHEPQSVDENNCYLVELDKSGLFPTI